MKLKYYLTLIYLFAISIQVYAVKGYWQLRADMPLKRSGHVAFTLNGYGYVCGGIDSLGNELHDLWQYTEATNSWSQKASLPEGGRIDLVSFVIDSLAYVGGGRSDKDNKCYNTYYEYNPNTDSWTRIKDCPVKRYAGAGFAIDTLGYIACGRDIGGPRMDDCYAYDPRTNEWSRKADLEGPGGRTYPLALTHDGKCYMFGGINGDDPSGGNVLTGIWVYDPANNTWDMKWNMFFGSRARLIGFTMNGYFYLGCGGMMGDQTSFVEWFRAARDTNYIKWEYYESHPAKNYFGESFVIGKKGYTVGYGSNLNNYHTTYSFTDSVYSKVSVKMIESAQDGVYFDQTNHQLCLSLEKSQYQLQVLDVTGKQLVNETIQKDDKLLQYPLKQLGSGVYFARLAHADTCYVLKFVVD